MNRVTGDVTFTGERAPWADRPGMEQVGWRVELRYQRRRMTVQFYSTSEPTIADVLECIYSDATSADESFEEWADNMGYDEDSRSAYATWEAVQAQAAQLRRLLGDDYDRLVYAS